VPFFFSADCLSAGCTSSLAETRKTSSAGLDMQDDALYSLISVDINPLVTRTAWRSNRIIAETAWNETGQRAREPKKNRKRRKRGPRNAKRSGQRPKPRRKTNRTDGSAARCEREATMASHKFHIGQSVSYRPASRNQDAPRGAYKIVARLPQGDDGQFEYRIKHSGEAHERIAKEAELSLI
jgi:hypothetical protein